MAWRLVLAAVVASALPDLDYFAPVIWPAQAGAIPVYWHRGAAHSLFAALAAGVLAAACHRFLKVRPLTAFIAIAAAMASHGLLDMLTDYGEPVAYLWPLSSIRVFADWRPLHSGPIKAADFTDYLLVRQRIELWQIILPTMAAAIMIRLSWTVLKKAPVNGCDRGRSEAAEHENSPLL